MGGGVGGRLRYREDLSQTWAGERREEDGAYYVY